MQAWVRRVGGEWGCGNAGRQDTGEDVGVGKEVEGRWSHCDLHASHHIY